MRWSRPRGASPRPPAGGRRRQQRAHRTRFQVAWGATEVQVRLLQHFEDRTLALTHEAVFGLLVLERRGDFTVDHEQTVVGEGGNRRLHGALLAAVALGGYR